MARENRLRAWSLLLVIGSFLGREVAAACGDQESASYQLQFQGLWSERSFPKSYPKYRKNAQWSTLIGLSHSDHYNLWEPGQLATVPFRDFVEGEDESGKLLQREMVNLQGSSAFAAKSLSTGTGRSVADVILHGGSTKISFAVRIVPSPDWFVGLSGLDLCEDGAWRKGPLHFDLQPWDAGTDGGYSFTSPDYVSNPQEPITLITAAYPDHPANSFFYPKLETLAPIARVTLVWQETDADTWTKYLLPVVTGLGKPRPDGSGGNGDGPVMPRDSPEFDFPGIDLPTVQETIIPYDCEVTSWGSWSPCDQMCKVGLRRRFRLVVERPKNGGQDCPDLIGVEVCKDALTRPQKRCAKTRIKKEIKKYMKVQRRNYMGKKKRNKFIV